MAYLEKYYISYCDDFGVNRKVSILELDYVGSSTELTADENPISIDYESDDDFKFSPIRPSKAEVFLVFDSEDSIQFEEFWTADEKQFLIQEIKDGQVEWSGYVIPNGFQYEFTGGKYYASLNASDGLSTLEALTFIDDNLKPYGNQDLVYNNGFEFPFSLIITEILRKLELDLDLWVCINSYEQSMTKTGDVRDADPLSAAYVNVKTYIKESENEDIPYWYGSGEEWNCKEVLENICHIFGAKIYQEDGVWRMKSTDADVNYGTGATQLYWRKYNTAGTYLFDYEVVDDEINVPCNSLSKVLIGDDHLMYMDEVYKAFRMNYEYTFLRDGDTPLNLIKNGNFANFDDSSNLSAPNFWSRFVYYFQGDDEYVRVRSVDISDPNDVNGYTKAIEFGKQATGTSIADTTQNMLRNTGLIYSEVLNVKNGDRLFFEIWNRYTYKKNVWLNIRSDYYTVMYRLILITDENGQGEQNKYFLRNGDLDTDNGFAWQQASSVGDNIIDNTDCFYLLAPQAKNYDSANDEIDFWYNFKSDFPNAPETGRLFFVIHGIAIKPASGIRNRSYPKRFPAWTLRDGIYQRTTEWRTDNGYSYLPNPYNGSDIQNPLVTGVFLGTIPSGNELPEQQDYIYNNDNPEYTLQVDPITIYNGDVQDAKHISNIIVPTNTGGKNFWQDLAEDFTPSSLGLLTVRQIMRQYFRPNRIFEGTVKLQDARFGSVYTFEAIPDIRFVLLRGSFNKQKQYIENGTFAQLSDDTLPDGGTEGGNSLEPEWIATGDSYCEVGEYALNTGYVYVEEIDINPNSETYGETREILSESQDLTQCPLNTPRLYYWGSDDVYLNTFTLNFSPYTEINSKEIQVSFDNEEGNYLYFVHLKSLGSVERIYTLTTPNNVISDWVYLADVLIDGYLYRVLRTDYVMTEFTDFEHTFKFA